MSAIDHLLHANDTYAKTFAGARPVRPKLRLTILTCMDSRLDLFGALGLDIGDAHILRNAGGIPTEEMLRSIAISQRKLGTREIAVMQHSNCGMENFDDEAFRAELTSETGVAPTWSVSGFTDIQAEVRKSVQTILDCPWLPHRDDVRGFVFDVTTARITEV
jgi:carbonic anhydrase